MTDGPENPSPRKKRSRRRRKKRGHADANPEAAAAAPAQPPPPPPEPAAPRAGADPPVLSGGYTNSRNTADRDPAPGKAQPPAHPKPAPRGRDRDGGPAPDSRTPDPSGGGRGGRFSGGNNGNGNGNAGGAGPDTGGRKRRKVRTKQCVHCMTPCTTIHRVQIDHRRRWVFICDVCWPTRCVDNPHYAYGGLWVAGRVMKPESQIMEERRGRRP